MAQGKNTAAIVVNLAQIAPALVHLLQMFGGTHTGAEKKAAAIEAGKQLVIGAGEAALANNPKFNENYGAVIQGAFDLANASGSLASVTLPDAPQAA